MPSTIPGALEDVAVVVNCVDQPQRGLLHAAIQQGLAYTDITPYLVELGRGAAYDHLDRRHEPPARGSCWRRIGARHLQRDGRCPRAHPRQPGQDRHLAAAGRQRSHRAGVVRLLPAGADDAIRRARGRRRPAGRCVQRPPGGPVSRPARTATRRPVSLFRPGAVSAHAGRPLGAVAVGAGPWLVGPAAGAAGWHRGRAGGGARPGPPRAGPGPGPAGSHAGSGRVRAARRRDAGCAFAVGDAGWPWAGSCDRICGPGAAGGGPARSIAAVDDPAGIADKMRPRASRPSRKAVTGRAERLCSESPAPPHHAIRRTG